jgi:hypothetical protein
MVTEQDPRIRGPITGEFEFTNTATTTRAKGELIQLNDVCGVFLENVGTSGDLPDRDTNRDHINGNKGVFVFACDKMIVYTDGSAIDAGEFVYCQTASNQVGVNTADPKCGVALESVGTTDCEILIQLRPF